jgi:hypothetical protein
MLEKLLEKSFFILLLSILILLFLNLISNYVFAAPVDTQVDVGDVGTDPPAFLEGPQETQESSIDFPTNVGDSVEWTVLAETENSDDYYLAICKTDNISPNNGSAPTCLGGAWCIGDMTDSSVEAFCSYTTLESDSNVNQWYGFVCSHSATNSLCSDSSQGNGEGLSPFYVNKPAEILTISSGSALPGGTLTWTATIQHSNTIPSMLNAKILVCTTNSLTDGECSAHTLCSSTFTNAGEISCTYTVPIPESAGVKNAFLFVIDPHGLEAAADSNKTLQTYTILNSPPSSLNVLINRGDEITLVENGFAQVPVSLSALDNNGASDLKSIFVSLYKDSTIDNCKKEGQTNYTKCYAHIECMPTQELIPGTSSVRFECLIPVQFIADDTFRNTSSWTVGFELNDSQGSYFQESNLETDILEMIGIDIENDVNYLDSKPGIIGESINISSTGNTDLNIEISGTAITSKDENIDTYEQRYSQQENTEFLQGETLLMNPKFVNFSLTKSSSISALSSKKLFFGLEKALSLEDYATNITILGVLDED